MLQRLTVANVYVLDQERAKSFYVDTLGFELREDMKLEDFRWLTVGPKGQPEMHIALMALRVSSLMPQAAVDALRTIIETSGMPAGVFESADCRKTYEELKTKGVKFDSPPKDEPYGIECMARDDSGNWFSIVQPAK